MADPRKVFVEMMKEVKGDNRQLTEVIEMDTVRTTFEKYYVQNETRNESHVCEWDSAKAIIHDIILMSNSSHGDTSGIQRKQNDQS